MTECSREPSPRPSVRVGRQAHFEGELPPKGRFTVKLADRRDTHTLTAHPRSTAALRSAPAVLRLVKLVRAAPFYGPNRTLIPKQTSALASRT